MYTNRSYTDTVGNSPDDGSYFGTPQCKDGKIITSFNLRAGRYLDQLSATCSDGYKLGPYGGNGGGAYTVQGPFTSIDGTYGDWVDSLYGIGQPGGRPSFSLKCPAGKYVVGFEGRSGEYMGGKFRAICGVKDTEYCVDNLETDLCRNMDRDTLNKACSKNMSTTCRNRKDELDESIIQTYCKGNKNDPFCSCYADAPDYIPQEIRGLVKCWNKTCAEQGYVPKNLRGSCPNITVCKQTLGADGSNVLSSNVFVQDCGTRILPPGTTTTSTTTAPPTTTNTTTTGTPTIKTTVFNDVTKSPYVPDSPANNASSNEVVDFIKKNKTLIFVIVIVLAVVFGIIFWPKSPPPRPPVIAYPVPQQYYAPMNPANQPMNPVSPSNQPMNPVSPAMNPISPANQAVPT